MRWEESQNGTAWFLKVSKVDMRKLPALLRGEVPTIQERMDEGKNVILIHPRFWDIDITKARRWVLEALSEDWQYTSGIRDALPRRLTLSTLWDILHELHRTKLINKRTSATGKCNRWKLGKRGVDALMTAP